MNDSLAKANTEIDSGTYLWASRIAPLLKRSLKVNVRLFDAERLNAGNIFVFNHFARFETFIPQYLIYDQVGAYSRSIASSSFFKKDDTLRRFLQGAGAVSNQMPDLLPFLVKELLHDRKIIIFPEGGMVKDRRVIDRKGGYSIFSRTSMERRRHHTGAARIGFAAEKLKAAILDAHDNNDEERLVGFVTELGFENQQQMLDQAKKPTLVVAGNITFFPIRIGANLLHRTVSLFTRGLSHRVAEELKIEGNILLKDTDMDIRLGPSIRVDDQKSMLYSFLFQRRSAHVNSLVDCFQNDKTHSWLENTLYQTMTRQHARKLRDNYMLAMYREVSVNICHLAAQLIIKLLMGHCFELAHEQFRLILYRIIKKVQQLNGVRLHRSLSNPQSYQGLLQGECEGWERLLDLAQRLDLIVEDDSRLVFLGKLTKEFEFDKVRLENPVIVYANEVAPMSKITAIIDVEINNRFTKAYQIMVKNLYSDACRLYRVDTAKFDRQRYAEINQQQTATADAEPFFYQHENSTIGVLVVHGFLSSPEEVRGLGNYLHEQGYTVYGPRLKGHGTSPWDLHQSQHEQWQQSVNAGFRVLELCVDKIIVVGFSTGGLLCLNLAAQHAEKLAALIAICTPTSFVNKQLMWVPLINRASRIMSAISGVEGVMAFRPGEPENPQVNYNQIPIQALHELSLLREKTLGCLNQVQCPALIIQATDDPVVEAKSASKIYESIGSQNKKIKWIDADIHGIVYRNTANVWQVVLDQIRLDVRSHEVEGRVQHLG